VPSGTIFTHAQGVDFVASRAGTRWVIKLI
jgi:hypothetical protein